MKYLIFLFPLLTTGCVTISNVPPELEVQTNVSAQFMQELSKGISAYVDAAVLATDGMDKKALEKAGAELQKRATQAVNLTLQTAEAVANLRKIPNGED